MYHSVNPTVVLVSEQHNFLSKLKVPYPSTKRFHHQQTKSNRSYSKLLQMC